MFTVNQWLDVYKFHTGITTDYRLAKSWQIPSSYISKYRQGRLKLPIWIVLKIARQIGVEPMEIIAIIEYKRVPEKHREAIKTAYFDALVKTIGARMSAASLPKYRPKYWRHL